MELISASQVTRANQAEALQALLGINPDFASFAPLAGRVVVMDDGVMAIPVSPSLLVKYQDFNDDDEFINVGPGEAFTFPLAMGEAELDAKFVANRLVKVFQEHSFQLDGVVQSVQIITLSDPKVFDQFPEAETMSKVLDAILREPLMAELKAQGPAAMLAALMGRRGQ